MQRKRYGITCRAQVTKQIFQPRKAVFNIPCRSRGVGDDDLERWPYTVQIVINNGIPQRVNIPRQPFGRLQRNHKIVDDLRF